MGVWIETHENGGWFTITMSLLMWECGLKLTVRDENVATDKVTPYVGVWIETEFTQVRCNSCNVTPYVGVWIETAYGQRDDDR